MNFAEFIQTNETELNQYSSMSKTAGAKVDFVQGGGGNTSVKTKNNIMAIKASGFKLSQVEQNEGYALLDYLKVQEFYNTNSIEQLSKTKDVEPQGAAAVKNAAVALEGFCAPRPSVEAGFHAIQKKFVLHTHSVYANLICCAKQGQELAKQIMQGAKYSYGWVAYTDPGTKLTYFIKEEIERVEKQTGEKPAIIFMQNHGIIATHDDATQCAKIHEDANNRIIDFFKISKQQTNLFETTKLSSRTQDTFFNTQEYLKQTIKQQQYDMDFFVKKALYPDQLVFLVGNIEISQDETPNFETLKAACTVFPKTGDVFYKTTPAQAQTIQDTLVSIFFITQTIKNANLDLSTMDDAGKSFIENWESEKYRKSIVQ